MNRKNLLIATITIACLTAGLIIWQPWQAESFTGDFGPENGQFRHTETKNLSPYAMFGDSSFVLMTEAERTGSHSLLIPVKSNSSDIRLIAIELKTGLTKTFNEEGLILKEFILPPEVFARFIQVDPRSDKYPGWSPYNYVLGNPILNIDPQGDTVKTTQEGYSIINEGLTATLGSSHPFGYNSETGTLTFNSGFDRSAYNETQLQVIDQMGEVVTNEKLNETRVVNATDPLAELGGQSLQQRGLNGATFASVTNGSYDYSISFIARQPKRVGSIVNPEYDPNNLMSKQFIPGWVNDDINLRGVAALHEIGGHTYLRMAQPALSQSTHNQLVEDFETSFRQVYRIGTYEKNKQVRRANTQGLNVQMGDPIYLRGSAEKH